MRSLVGHRSRFTVLLAAAALLGAAAACPPSLHGQGIVQGGIYATRANDAFGGTFGGGFLAAVDPPALPLQARAFVERFMPDCGRDPDGRKIVDCGFGGWGVDVLAILPTPVLSPWVSAGFVHRTMDPGDDWPDEDESGAALGLGARLSLPGGMFFGEARYELVKFARPAPEVDPLGREWLYRLGLMLALF